MFKRLRDLREDADLNQTAVAKFLGMSQTGYSKYETGENDVPTEVLINQWSHTISSNKKLVLWFTIETSKKDSFNYPFF